MTLVQNLFALGTSMLFAINFASSGPPRPPVYSDVKPIFSKHCVGCHSGKFAQRGLDLSTHQGILKGSKSRKVVVPGKPENSLLLKLVKGSQKPTMPPGAARLTPGEISQIYSWIKAGAKP